jgi:hypothetical protein
MKRMKGKIVATVSVLTVAGVSLAGKAQVRLQKLL